MQVIAGKYGGRKLLSIDEKSTRPTLARVKESLFSMIDEKVAGSIVLDLFAGSGSLGIEAISRGAKKVYFVEHNLEAVKVIKNNLKRVTEDYQIETKDYLDALRSFDEKFDLVLLDPPYNSDYAEKTLDMLAKRHLLNRDAIVTIEQDSKKLLQINDNEYIIIKSRIYGQSKVTILRYIGE